MKEEVNCEIVQDLLSKYIDHLTENKTNEFIEEHLKNCESCRNSYNLIQETLKNSDNETIHFFKKYHQKLKLLKITIIGILLTIVLIFICIVGRKMWILNDLKNKDEYNATLTNFYVKIYSYSNGESTTTQTYRKGNQAKTITTQYGSGNLYEYTTFWGESSKENHYSVIKSGTDITKIAFLNEPCNLELPTISLSSFPDRINNVFDLLKEALSVKITVINYEHFGKEVECYRLEWDDINKTSYIEKKSGLELRKDYLQQINDFQYVFNQVSDEIFVEPDLSEYEVYDNSEEL